MSSNLSYIYTPSNSHIDPPINSRVQELPINSLSWEDFEKLVLRIVEIDFQISDCQIYGRKGQRQYGIDIYALKANSKYNSYQCKKYSKLTKTNIKKAIQKFIEGTWITKSDKFYFCTSFPMDDVALQDEFELQKNKLAQYNVELKRLDKLNIERILKKNAVIVYDFFGEAWVKKFNGDRAGQEIVKTRKLDATQIIEYRKKLKEFYSTVFNTTDHGLPVLSKTIYSLQERYIIPDVIPESLNSETSEVGIIESTEKEIERILKEDYYASDNRIVKEITSRRTQQKPNVFRRVSFDQINLSEDKLIVLGDAGSGKSSLLRFLTLDILSQTPVLEKFSKEMSHLLPVWLPFAFICKNLGNNNNLSIPELLKLWLGSHGEERLFDLVNDALQDERLLLIVDGIDEWNSITHAKLALSRINIHLNYHRTKGIFSSRPYGYKLIEESINQSELISLAPFSNDQQKDFTLKWLTKWVSTIKSDNKDTIIEKLQRTFQNDIERSPDLSFLAKNPLLLGILISLKINNTKLPRTKVEALKTICEYLINQHPAERRSQANIVIENSWDFELIDIFSEVAIKIQLSSNDGTILKSEARDTIINYLKDEMGFEAAKAKKRANELIEVGANDVGIIVEKSSEEIAFIHRQFQEYLAGYYLSNSENDFIENILTQYSQNQDWHQVIIILFSLIPQRKKQQFQICINAVEQVESIQATRTYSEFLKFELGITLVNAPIEIIRESFIKLKNRFENESNERIKNVLFEILLKSLDNSKIKEDILEYLLTFFPYPYKYTDYRVYSLIKKSHLSNAQEKFLLELLVNGNIHQQQDVSVALSKFIDSGNLKARILELLESSTNPRLIGFLLNTLISDKIKSDFKTSCLEKTKNTMHQEINFFNVKLKVHLGLQTEEDLEIFLDNQIGLHYVFEDEVYMVLADGWPKSTKLMEECLFSIKRHRGEGRLESKTAWKILFSCFNKNDEVIKQIKRELVEEEYPFIGMDAYRGWNYIALYFENNSKLQPEVDNWIIKQEFSEPEVAFAAKVSGTNKAKEALLEKLNKSSFPHWIVEALVNKWSHDSKVMSQLREFFEKENLNKSIYAAHLIDKVFINDIEKAISILDNYLLSENPLLDRAIGPYLRLDKHRFQKKYLPKILVRLEGLKKSMFGQYESSLDLIIKTYPNIEEVQNYLFGRLDFMEELNVFIRNYPDKDQLIDEHILKSRALPVSLRYRLIERISQPSIVDERIIQKLGDYNLEGEEEIKSLAAAEYFMLVKEIDEDKVLEIAKENSFYRGPEVDTMRSIGFAGFLICDKVQDYLELSTPQDKRPATPNLYFSPSYWRVPESLVRLLEDNFIYLQEKTGTYFQKLLKTSGQKEDDFWAFWASRSSGRKQIDDQIERFIQLNPDVTHIEFLEFLERTQPKSNLMKNVCIRVLDHSNAKRDRFYYGKDLSVKAGEILGEYFNHDTTVEKFLEEFGLSSNSYNWYHSLETGKITALCIGWPKKRALKTLFDKIVEANEADYEWVNKNIGFNLKFLFRDDDNILEFLFEVIHNHNHYKQHRKYYLNPLIRRIKLNNKTSSQIKRKLVQSNNDSVIISFYELLRVAQKLDIEIFDWKNQITVSNGYGYNIISNQIESVHDILFDFKYSIN